MDEFASCYFCGTAVESPVEEYPLVGDDVDPDLDTGATVALCPTCRRKLDTVLEPVIEAVERLQADLAGDEEAPRDGAEPDGDEPDGAEDVGIWEDLEDETSPGSDPEAPGDGDDGSIGEPATFESAYDESDLGSTASGDGPDSASDPSADPESASEPEKETAAADEHDDVGDEGEPDRETTTATDDDASGDGTAGDEGSIPVEDIPVDAYNKIVRLLKNREFPVDRAEIEEVASSAYDIPGDDCRRAIDAMVDRGVLAEDGGQLVPGDDARDRRP